MVMEYSDSVAVSMIRQYCFCPRVVYFTWILGHKPAMPKWVAQGERYHLRTEMLNKRRNLSRYKLNSADASLRHDIHLSCDALSLHGICDAVIETDEKVYPLEFKLDLERVYRGQIMQVVAYGMLLEHHYNKQCDMGFILHGEKGKTYQVHIDNAMRNDVKKIIIAINMMGETALLPHSSASAKQCIQCEFLNLCNDRF